MQTWRITSRRHFLRLSALGAASALLAACAQPTASPTAAPAAATPAAASAGGAVDRIKKAGKFVVLMDATFKPMEYVDEKGNVVGADVDLATELAKELGVTVQVQKTAWDAIFASLQAGKGDAIMSSVTITDDRKKEMLFSDTYFASGQLIAVRADNSAITSEKDLVGKVVGVQIDTTGQEAAEAISGIKEIKKYDGGADTMAAVDASKVEAAVMDAPVALAYVKEHPTVKVVSKTPFTTEPYGIALQKDATDLQTFVNQTLAKMKADGRLDAIFAKYGLK